MRSFAGLQEHPEIYLHMQGPNEFVITGTLKDWDITDRLGEIGVPTLITAGRHDEFTPRQAEALHPRDQELRARHLREQLAHAVRRGAGALRPGRRRLPRAGRAGVVFAPRWRATTRCCSI
jgi:hypothetical protein